MSELFMKYAVTVAIQDTTAATVANAKLDEWIMKFERDSYRPRDEV